MALSVDEFPPILNRNQGAQYVGVSLPTFDAMRADPTFPERHVPGVRTVRIVRAALDEWLATPGGQATAQGKVA